MEQPNVFKRLLLSLVVFFRFIFDGAFAGRVLDNWRPQAVRTPRPPAEPAPLPVTQPAEPVRAVPAAPAPKMDPSPALHLLAILQREGRLVDFLQEDIAAYDDADVGAAARVVHEGCRRALSEHVTLEPLRTESEGATVSLPPGFDAGAVRLTGNVTGQPPFLGALRHHGWRAAEVKLPAVAPGQDARIIAPAEVEL